MAGNDLFSSHHLLGIDLLICIADEQLARARLGKSGDLEPSDSYGWAGLDLHL